MTKRDANKLAALMRRRQQRLGLQNWAIRLEIHDRTELPRELSPECEDAIGHINSWDEQEKATIHLAEHARDLSHEEIIIHELVHLVLREATRAHERLKSHVAPEVWRLAVAEWDDGVEVAIGRLVRALKDGEEDEDQDEGSRTTDKA